ncbi:MAG: manganese efflux pump MntP family protein, partial [Methyloversatilis sp.]|nr:manganese efflux pump MntP family protein [Methyloversatilis sp.]
MDAFAVAVTQGACLDIRTLRYPLSIGITFGFFQALMPLLGWLAGSSFSSMIQHLDHWIALVLLAIIGVKMFIDGYIDYRRKRSAKENGLACEVSCGGELRFHDLMMMGIATSIDALAVGITFGMLRIDIWSSILVIGLTTFLFSTSGVYLGKRAGPLLGDRM